MPHRRRRHPVALLFLPALLAPLPALAQPSRAQVDRELTAVYARFSEGYRRADARMVANLYADSAFYLQPGARITRGREEVFRNFEAFLGPYAQRGEPGPDIRFDIVDRDVSGNLAYDIGYYTIGGAAEPDGKFIVLWKRGADGQWRMHADGYSGVTPPRPPGATGQGGAPPFGAGEAMALGASDLQRFVGSYRSAAPAVDARVELENGALVLKPAGMPPATMVPAGTWFRLEIPGAPPGARVDVRVAGDKVEALRLVIPGGNPPIVFTPVP